MVTKITDIFCNFLNDYCSRVIWNEPQKEYRHNIKLSLQQPRPQVSVWNRNIESVVLPINKDPLGNDLPGAQYFVYAMPLSHFAGLDVRSSDWKPVTALLKPEVDSNGIAVPNSDKRIQLRVHDSTGKRLLSSQVYIKSSSVDPDEILVAINAKMLRKIVDTDEKDIYFGVYFDSDLANDIDIECYECSELNKATIVANASTATVIFKNGFAVRSLTSSDLNIKDYVELVFDQNVVGKFTIDLASDEGGRMYVAEDGQSKHIIHVPKALNEKDGVYTSRLISHDTCDFYIYPRNLKNKNQVGRFIHRAQGKEDLSFIQITHNDFGVPTALIDTFKGYLGTDEVTIDCFIRYHERVDADGNPKKLVRDRNYIDFLYQLSDSQILDFLEGNGPAKIDFWKASELEQSNYISIMKDTIAQDLPVTLDFYTEALGYVNTASLLSGRIYRKTGVTSSKTMTLSTVLPLVYQYKTCPSCGMLMSSASEICPNKNCQAPQTPFNLIADVYLNGLKIPYTDVTSKITNRTGNIDNNSTRLVSEVTLNGKTVTETDEIVVEVREMSPFISYVFEPTLENHVFYIPKYNKEEEGLSSSFNCYVVKRLLQPVKTVVGDQIDSYVAVDISDLTVSDLGDIYRVIFDQTNYGRKYIFQSKEGSYAKYIDINNMVQNHDNIAMVPGDDGHSTSIVMYDPLTSVNPIDSDATATGAEVYVADGAMFWNVTNICTIEAIGVGKLRVTLPDRLANTGCMIVFYGVEEEVPVFTEQKISAYLNGRMLVENVDYHRVKPTTNLPYQYVFHNVSYIEDTNYMELSCMNERNVQYLTNFVSSEYINSKKDPILFYNQFTSLFTDGQNLMLLQWENGRVKNVSETVPTRSGALYVAKTEVPQAIRKYLNEDYLTEDIQRFNQIVDYFSKRTADDPAIFTIPHSHRVYSVYLNAIIDAVLDGRLVLPAETDINRLLTYLTDWEYLKRYDLPLMFTETTEYDIDGNPTGRVTRKSVINRTFIDVFPSYTQRLIPGSTLYATLNKLIDYIIPTDTVVDTVGVDTTINNNQGNE